MYQENVRVVEKDILLEEYRDQLVDKQFVVLYK
jgi:hypothetical protein